MKFKDKTRGGYPVRIYATDAEPTYPIHGAVLLVKGWRAQSWTTEGRNFVSVPDGALDLIPLREPSEAAVEAARRASISAGSRVGAPYRDVICAALRAAYAIDFPEGGE